MRAPAWLASFPALSSLQGPAWQQLLAAARVQQLPAGTALFHAGQTCQQFMLVLSGSVRVEKNAVNGRELVLYRVEAGQSCILTSACLLGGSPYQADGVTETAVEAVVIPAAIFRQALDSCAGLRAFVFEQYSQRITELLMLVEAVTFSRLDERLAAYLLRHAEQGQLLQTHQQLAAELGSAREVVSRLLKEFERNGWLRLQRGRIQLENQQALAQLGSPELR
ncbi:Crp/Fnr family transcriptional regulator [Balneatrix alpica]|uniref:Crp/Fnr family transcriptional regulator n=1 Tax=Balneatrix alpica TaxID=75684 RepID=UPI002738174F|nr:Crp/Fnr family transcriptional regulator [Balneatrix alpica]